MNMHLMQAEHYFVKHGARMSVRTLKNVSKHGVSSNLNEPSQSNINNRLRTQLRRKLTINVLKPKGTAECALALILPINPPIVFLMQ